MKKKITISESQLKKVLGISEAFNSYFSNHDDGVAGTHETNADGICMDANNKTDISASEPLTADKFTWELVRRNNMMGTYRSKYEPVVSMAESKKKLQEDNSNLKGNRYFIPDELMNNLQQISNRLGDKTPKRLLSLVNSRDNGLSYKEMYRLKGVFDGTDANFKGNIDDIGGNDMRNWVNQQLEMSKANDKQRRDFDQKVLGKKKLNRPSVKGEGSAHESNLEPKITYFE